MHTLIRNSLTCYLKDLTQEKRVLIFAPVFFPNEDRTDPGREMGKVRQFNRR